MRRKHIFIIAGIMAVAALSGAIAYVSSHDERTNVVSVGEVSVSIDEPLWAPDETENGTEYARIEKNTVYGKNPTLYNDGSNEAYVFISVGMPVLCGPAGRTDDLTRTALLKLINSDGNPGVNSGWVLQDVFYGETADTGAGYRTGKDRYVYAYSSVLEPGESVSCFEGIECCLSDGELSLLDGSGIQSLDVTGYAVQSSIAVSDEGTPGWADAYGILAKEVDGL